MTIDVMLTLERPPARFIDNGASPTMQLVAARIDHIYHMLEQGQPVTLRFDDLLVRMLHPPLPEQRKDGICRRT